MTTNAPEESETDAAIFAAAAEDVSQEGGGGLAATVAATVEMMQDEEEVPSIVVAPAAAAAAAATSSNNNNGGDTAITPDTAITSVPDLLGTKIAKQFKVDSDNGTAVFFGVVDERLIDDPHGHDWHVLYEASAIDCRCRRPFFALCYNGCQVKKFRLLTHIIFWMDSRFSCCRTVTART